MYYGDIERKIISFIEISVKDILKDLRKPLGKAESVIPGLDIPKDKAHGDLATNVAMKASKFVSMPPP